MTRTPRLKTFPKDFCLKPRDSFLPPVPGTYFSASRSNKTCGFVGLSEICFMYVPCVYTNLKSVTFVTINLQTSGSLSAMFQQQRPAGGSVNYNCRLHNEENTHTHTYTNSFTHTFTLSQSLTHSIALTHAWAHTHTRTPSLTRTHTHKLTRTQSNTYTHIHTQSQTHIHTHAPKHAGAHTLTHTHTVIFRYIL